MSRESLEDYDPVVEDVQGPAKEVASAGRTKGESSRDHRDGVASWSKDPRTDNTNVN